jgi:hypothetical protein
VRGTRPGAAVHPRVRLLERADVARLGPGRVARLGRADAPPQLHPLRRPGGDWGAIVTDARARQAPEGLLGIHLNLLWPPGDTGDTEDERAALAALATFHGSGSGYFLEQSTRPQTIGYVLFSSFACAKGNRPVQAMSRRVIVGLTRSLVQSVQSHGDRQRVERLGLVGPPIYGRGPNPEDRKASVTTVGQPGRRPRLAVEGGARVGSWT